MAEKTVERWSEEEIALLEKYFSSTMGELALYMSIQAINSNRTYEAVMRQIRKYKANGYEKGREKALKKLRVGYLDIETTNLAANFGYMICWFIKEGGKDHYDSGIITKKEIFDYEFDKRITKELLEAMSHYDILYTHYGSDRRFDVPFIRTRAYRWELENLLPDRMEQFIMDTYPLAKYKLRLHSYRLGSIAAALGVKNVKKSVLDPEKWELARVGHPASLAYIYDHNKKDVQVLERVHQKLKKVERPIYRSI